MGWPQITMIILAAMNLGIDLSKHGESKIGRYNIFTSILGVGIQMFILYCGGFFN